MAPMAIKCQKRDARELNSLAECEINSQRGHKMNFKTPRKRLHEALDMKKVFFTARLLSAFRWHEQER